MPSVLIVGRMQITSQYTNYEQLPYIIKTDFSLDLRHHICFNNSIKNANGWRVIKLFSVLRHFGAPGQGLVHKWLTGENSI